MKKKNFININSTENFILLSKNKSIFGILILMFLHSWCKFLSKNVEFVSWCRISTFYYCQDHRVLPPVRGRPTATTA